MDKKYLDSKLEELIDMPEIREFYGSEIPTHLELSSDKNITQIMDFLRKNEEKYGALNPIPYEGKHIRIRPSKEQAKTFLYDFQNNIKKHPYLKDITDIEFIGSYSLSNVLLDYQ